MTFRKYSVTLLCIVCLLVSSVTSATGYLSVNETLELAKNWHRIGYWNRPFHPDLWRGNPAAKTKIYEEATAARSYMTKRQLLSYIGFIGNKSDVPILLRFLPKEKDDITLYAAEDVVEGVVDALAILGNRGYKDAQNRLLEMTRQRFWNALGIKDVQRPVAHKLRVQAMLAYLCAGTGDVKKVINDFDLEGVPGMGVQKVRDILWKEANKIRSEFERYGIWKISRSNLEVARSVADGKKPIKVAGKPVDKVLKLLTEQGGPETPEQEDAYIDGVLVGLSEPVYWHLAYKVPDARVEKVCDELQLKADSLVHKEILFVGVYALSSALSPSEFNDEAFCVEALLKYVDELNPPLSEQECLNAAATLMALYLIPNNSMVFRKLDEMLMPDYWNDREIEPPKADSVPEDVLIFPNALAYATLFVRAARSGKLPQEKDAEYYYQKAVGGEDQKELMQRMIGEELQSFMTKYKEISTAKSLFPVEVVELGIFELVVRYTEVEFGPSFDKWRFTLSRHKTV